VDASPDQPGGPVATATTDPHGGYEEKIAKLRLILYAATAVLAGLGTVLVLPFDLNTPLAPGLAFAGAAVSGVSAVISQVIEKADNGFKNPKFVYRLLLVINVAYLALAAVLWFTSTYDIALQEDEPEEAQIPPGSEETFGFSVQPGDFVILRVFALNQGLDLSVRALNEERVELVEKVEDRLWEMRAVLVGGDWTVTVTDNTTSGGKVRVRYEVSRQAEGLRVGSSLRGQVIATKEDKLGYVIQPDTDVEVDLVAGDLSPSDLPLGISVFRGTTLVSPPVVLDGRSYSVPLILRGGTTYVVAVTGLGDGTGRFTLSLIGNVTEPPPPTTMTSPPVDLVELPDIYNVEEASAYEALAEVELVPQSITVCSGSVDAGRIRQAFTVEEDGTETIVADEPGVVTQPVLLNRGTTVTLKVSNGTPCA
jgi:hypothetical protein